MAPPPGLLPPPGTPNHGSVSHMRGNCRPCAWFWKARGCKNGEECGHCHLCPEGEIKARKKEKQTMMRLGLATPKVAFGSDEQDVMIMMGLATPKVALDSGEQDLFSIGYGGEQKKQEKQTCLEKAEALGSPDPGSSSDPESTHFSGSDQGSTTSPSSEQELAANSEDEELLDSAPLVLPPGLELPAFTMPNISCTTAPSIGSTLHGSGTCQPCAWFWKPDGCQSDLNCRFCHMCPEGELKARKKSKRDLMRLGLATPKSDILSFDQAKEGLKLASLL